MPAWKNKAAAAAASRAYRARNRDKVRAMERTRSMTEKRRAANRDYHRKVYAWHMIVLAVKWAENLRDWGGEDTRQSIAEAKLQASWDEYESWFDSLDDEYCKP